MGSERRYWYGEGLDPVELEFPALRSRAAGPATRAEKTFFGGLALD
jgi:hypothetical protein